MGDISAEPSMEDILSSIKRIIAEEGETATAAHRARRAARPLAPRAEPETLGGDSYGHEEVLELSDAVDEEAPLAVQKPAAPVAAARVAAAPAAPVAADPLLSQRTAEASRGPLDALSRMVVKPEIAGSDTLEALVREMLRPMLAEWLDANLPGLVETMVSREIARITGGR